MKKDYFRFEQDKAFGVIASASNILWLAPNSTSSNSGRGLVASLESASIWDLKTGQLLTQLNDEQTPSSAQASSSSTKYAEVTVVAEFQAQMIATGHSNGVIKIWDSISGSMIVAFNGHKKAVTTLKFDSTGTRLVSGSKDTNIIMWDLVNEVGLYRLRSHRDQIVGLELIKGKSKIITTNDEGEEQEEEIDSEEEIWLLSASKDGTVKLWDLETQHCIETHMAHKSNDCWSLAYSPSLGLAMTGSGNKEIGVWKVDLSAAIESAEVGKRLFKLGSINKQSSDRAHTIKFFTPEQEGEVKFVAVASSDRSIEFFKIKSLAEIKKSIARKLKRRREKGLDVDSVDSEYYLSETDPNEKFVSYTVIRTPAKIKSFDFAYQEYQTESGSPAILSSDKYKKPSFKDQIVLIASLANNSIDTYAVTAKGGKESHKAGPAEYARQYSIELPGHRTDIRALSLSSDDKMLASASNGLLKVWNVKTQNCIRTFECGYALCCSFLPGDGLIVVGTKTGQLELYDVASSTLLETVDAHSKSGNNGSVWSLHVGSDGKTFVTAGGSDRTVKFWEIKVVHEQILGTNRKVAKMKFKNTKTLELDDDVMAVRLSPDMKLVACSLFDSTVKVFFTESLKFFLNLYGHKLPVLSMDISQDSKLLVTCSADKNIKIWGLDFGDCHRSIFAHQESIMGVAFDPIADPMAAFDGGFDDEEGAEVNSKIKAHNFFSVSKDHLVKYWDGDNFQQLQKLEGHHSEIWALTVAHSGDFIVTGSHDKSIRVWKRTDEQLFLNEEREKELESMYESTLTASFETDENKKRELGPDEIEGVERDDDEDEENRERVGKQTIDTLKAGEKLIEALEIGLADLKLEREFEEKAQVAKSQDDIIALKNQWNSQRHIILVHKNISASEYVLNTALSIKPSELEDALLVLPFDKVIGFFEFISLWVSPPSKSAAAQVFNTDKYQNGAIKIASKMTVISRLLFTLLRLYHRQLISNHALRETLENLRSGLKQKLAAQRDIMGYNQAGLKVLKNTWNAQHLKEFIDEEEQRKRDERLAKKRIFTTI